MNLKSKIRAAVRHLILSTLGQFAKPQPSVQIFCMTKLKMSQKVLKLFAKSLNIYQLLASLFTLKKQ